MFKDQANQLPNVRRINVTEMYEVRQWADRYGCTPEEIRAAVRAVGNVADDVQRHLAGARLAQGQSTASGARAALEAAFAPKGR